MQTSKFLKTTVVCVALFGLLLFIGGIVDGNGDLTIVGLGFALIFGGFRWMLSGNHPPLSSMRMPRRRGRRW
jgi:hypothetical protein